MMLNPFFQRVSGHRTLNDSQEGNDDTVNSEVLS